MDFANTFIEQGFQEIKSVGKETGARREWRHYPSGELRGICWRERNADRKIVKFVGKKNEEFSRYEKVYEAWTRAD
jgi:hypothetical protein